VCASILFFHSAHAALQQQLDDSSLFSLPASGQVHQAWFGTGSASILTVEGSAFNSFTSGSCGFYIFHYSGEDGNECIKINNSFFPLHHALAA
jgi:hypothetical protein